ncbi:MAG: response regulator [Gammaproteobacteria bacterium]|nr:response regulator [Gammaproteobacteria bacterium]MBT4492216.1 response regulator [Gammaproteobacteria bacterium]
MSVILIVEDNVDNRELLEVILEVNNFSVLSEADGENGVRATVKHRPDLILMDINMPGINGFETLALLRAEETTKTIPVVAVTGNATLVDREEMVAAGFDRIVTKPFGIDEILSAIAETLEVSGS